MFNKACVSESASLRQTDSREFLAQLLKRVFSQLFEVHPFERRNVRRVQTHARRPHQKLLSSATRTLPAVACAQSGKAVSRRGRRQVVATLGRKLEKCVGQSSADEVQTEVAFAGVATAVAQKTRGRIAVTFAQRLA